MPTELARSVHRAKNMPTHWHTLGFSKGRANPVQRVYYNLIENETKPEIVTWPLCPKFTPHPQISKKQNTFCFKKIPPEKFFVP